jgi:hypothetical protein
MEAKVKLFRELRSTEGRLLQKLGELQSQEQEHK